MDWKILSKFLYSSLVFKRFGFIWLFFIVFLFICYYSLVDWEDLLVVFGMLYFVLYL